MFIQGQWQIVALRVKSTAPCKEIITTFGTQEGKKVLRTDVVKWFASGKGTAHTQWRWGPESGETRSVFKCKDPLQAICALVEMELVTEKHEGAI